MWTIKVDGWHYTVVDSTADLTRIINQIHRQHLEMNKRKYDIKIEYLKS